MDKLLDFNLPIFKTLSAYMSATLKSDNKNIKLINNKADKWTLLFLSSEPIIVETFNSFSLRI